MSKDGTGITDWEEYQRALEATRHIRPPSHMMRMGLLQTDRSTTNSLREAQAKLFSGLSEEEVLEQVLRASEQEAKMSIPSGIKRDVGLQEGEHISMQNKKSRILKENEVIDLSQEDDLWDSTGFSLGSSAQSETEKLYWNGEHRSVRTQLVPVDGPTFSLEELIGPKTHIQMVIAASYCWEMDWLQEHLPDPKLVPTIFFTQPTLESNGKVRQADEYTEGFGQGSIVSTAYLPGNFGCQHMKFLLLFFRKRLRVIVTSANLRSADWLLMNNTVFVQDVPLAKVGSPSSTHEWPEQFRRLFKAAHLDQAVAVLRQRHINKHVVPSSSDGKHFLYNFDWKKVEAILVMSIPGNHVDDEMLNMGMANVASQLRAKNWLPQANEEVHIEFQSSSLCKLTPKWASHLHGCFSGLSVQSLAQQKISQSPAPPLLRLLFPSLRTVEDSLLGLQGGGSMFCTSSHFTPDTKPFFFDSVCKYGGMLMHTKMVIALFKPKSPVVTSSKANVVASEVKRYSGWAYVAGSHNLSQAAWGHLSCVKGKPKIYLRNYELGVIIPLDRDNADVMADRIATWVRPAKQYGSSDIPFMQSIHVPT